MINEYRAKYFCSLTEEQKMKFTYKDFIKSEMVEIIEELLCKEEIKEEARMLFVECLAIEEVADKMFKDVKTIKIHKKKLSHALKRTFIKMFPYISQNSH